MLIQSVKKEAIIILHDLHSLAVLFVLPITFMLIMTLAMGEKHDNLVKKINIDIKGQANSEYSEAFIQYIKFAGFNVNTEDDPDVKITFKVGFDAALLAKEGNGHIAIDIVDTLSPQNRAMITELVKVALSKLKLHAYMEEIGDFAETASLAQKVAQVNQSSDVNYLIVNDKKAKIITAPTLYSIPSWLIFGIYFIVLPISTTLIKEKQNGTLLRVKTYPISTTDYFVNKAMSYSLVSVIQWLLLSVVGFYLVPWLTDQAFLQVNNISLYLLGGAFIIFAAIGFAFLLAAIVNTYEQAIVLGGGVNILLAAFSGFMVPIDIMPEQLAKLATASPMFWSAEIIKQALSGASISDNTGPLIFLALFGCLCFVASLTLFNIKSRKLSWT